MNTTQLEYGRSRNFSFDPSEVCGFLDRIFFAVRPGYGGVRTVPTIVTAQTFCASRDTRVSYGWCSLIQGYFCAV